MENKLEQLLNSLIEKGFRPFGRYDKLMGSGRFGSRQFVKFGMFPEEEFTLRELVSINSGLWQFCIENGLVEVDNHIPTLWEKKYKASGVESIYKNDIHFEKEFEYRLIESALKDDSELENFILDNIRIKGTK